MNTFKTFLESGNIQDSYRALEKEFAKLEAQVKGKSYKLDSTTSGNIWEKKRILELNIEILKKVLGK